MARGILTEEEFQDAWVSAEAENGGVVVNARVLAGDEAWAHTIWIPGQEVDTYRGLAAVIADSLQDFVAESQFAWGELRTSHYTIPPRSEPRQHG